MPSAGDQLDNLQPDLRRSLGSDVMSWLNEQVAVLYPGCFALVMATGIISNALFMEDYRELSGALFAVSLIIYPWLMVLTILRFVRFPRNVWADLINPRQVFSFFTIVAGTDVLGAAINLRGFGTIALMFWLFALILWFVLIYFSFGVLTFLTAHGANVVHGGWLIAIVGTESLVVLGTAIAPSLGDLRPSVFVLIHMLWGIGLGLYGIFIVHFSQRIFFFDIDPDDITPLLWVVMGAAAIATNAGSTLILGDSGLPYLNAMRPFIEGVTLVMWAWGTWWIPLLVLFGIWKHGICRMPLTYTPMLWSLVFPLGMYALASQRLSLAADFSPLQAISHAVIWVAVAAWAVAAGGLVAVSWRSFQGARSIARGSHLNPT
jgi:tellurite resistance protein TehA-like permease